MLLCDFEGCGKIFSNRQYLNVSDTVTCGEGHLTHPQHSLVPVGIRGLKPLWYQPSCGLDNQFSVTHR